MAQWMGAVGFELIIISDYIFDQIRKAQRVFADETTLPTLTPGDKARKCYLWPMPSIIDRSAVPAP